MIRTDPFGVVVTLDDGELVPVVDEDPPEIHHEPPRPTRVYSF